MRGNAAPSLEVQKSIIAQAKIPVHPCRASDKSAGACSSSSGRRTCGAVLPRSHRTEPWKDNKAMDKRRNEVERLFCRLCRLKGSAQSDSAKTSACVGDVTVRQNRVSRSTLPADLAAEGQVALGVVLCTEAHDLDPIHA